ncbi:MAG: cytochrome b [Deltaproteobacteria bacterium]|nr:cytochrome b [Deltaproteobacteria bacterium]
MLKNTIDSYGLIARLFHWIIFLMVIGVIMGGDIAADMPAGPGKAVILGLHKSFGFTILVLVVLRLLWRLTNPRPRDLGASRFQNKLGHAMHFFLYILLLSQPTIGILMSQAFGHPVYPFDLFEVPTFVNENIRLGKILLEIHETLWIVLAISVGIHAAAALKHHFIEKNRTLMRMIRGK